CEGCSHRSGTPRPRCPEVPRSTPGNDAPQVGEKARGEIVCDPIARGSRSGIAVTLYQSGPVRRRMRKSVRAALAAILLAAIAIRLSPLWSFLYWGSDTGEYFAILQSLLRTRHVSTVYNGWGITYPYFPGVFFPQAGLVDLAGGDVPTVMNLLIPILGAFAVVPMFLLAVRITKEARFGLFAAAFLAGAIPHAYTTAHAAPATLRPRVAWRYRPRAPGFRTIAASWLAAAVTLLAIGVVTILGSVPGTTVRVPPEGLAYFVPLVILLSFSAAGRRFLDFEKDGFHATVWLAILLLSALVGIAVAPRVILPYRHLEYLLIPFGIFAAVGFSRLLDLRGLRGPRRHLALAACAVLLVANGLAGIPPPSTFAGWKEGTIPAGIDPAYWARDHAEGLIVTDHHA